MKTPGARSMEQELSTLQRHASCCLPLASADGGSRTGKVSLALETKRAGN